MRQSYFKTCITFICCIIFTICRADNFQDSVSLFNKLYFNDEYEAAITIGTQLKSQLQCSDSIYIDISRKLAFSSGALNNNYDQSICILQDLLRSSDIPFEQRIRLLNDLGNCYIESNNPFKAQYYYAQAYELNENSITVCQNLAHAYYDSERFSDALHILSKSLNLIRDHQSDDYATFLNLMGICYYELNDINKSIDYLNEALSVWHSLGDDEGCSIALYNLANSYSSIGDFVNAIAMYEKSMEIDSINEMQNTSIYAMTLNNIALCYSQNGNTQKAIKYHEKSITTFKNSGTTIDVNYAAALCDLADLYITHNKLDEAKQLLDEAFIVFNKHESTKSHYYLDFLFICSHLYRSKSAIKEECDTWKSLATSIQDNILFQLSSLSSKGRERYWAKYSKLLSELYPNAVLHHGNNNYAAEIYDKSCLFSKGLLLSADIEMRKLILESRDSVALETFEQLQFIRKQLNTLYETPKTERKVSTDSLEQVAEKLELNLVQTSKTYGDYMHNLRLTWRDVQTKLNDKDIAVEFLSYPLEQDGSMAYIALTLCKNDTAPVLTRLFVESELLEVDEETHLNQKIDSLIWTPLSSRLEGKSRVYFSASGMLHNIGIEYLPSMEGKECYRLSSTRELVTHHTSSTISSATLYGGIDYKASYASIESSIPNSVKDYAMTASTSQNRGRFDYRTLRYGVSALPGTKEEITEVSAMLKPLGTSFETLSGTQASEESFKALSGQRKSLIHIATHGFYYNSEEADNLSDNMRLMFIGENRPRNVEDQSLLRCGLCFAGANQILSGESKPSDGQDDGILNALEIAQTDLRGLDLVVLSACQTALGDIAQGEGVFGLQRGFKKAGAQSILMSLWEVDNDATHLLMTEFYKGWTSGLSKYTALRQAQAVVKERYPDPKYWAAFILLDALD